MLQISFSTSISSFPKKFGFILTIFVLNLTFFLTIEHIIFLLQSFFCLILYLKQTMLLHNKYERTLIK